MSIFNLKQKLSLAKQVITKSSPIYVQFYITSRCNLACEQCNIIYGDAKHEEMNIEQIDLVAENLKKIGVSIVLLIGGEPFVRKDIHEIVKAFTKRNIHVRMQTNGLATEEQLQKCVEAGGRDISISLDSLHGEVQDKINGGFKKSWDDAIETISKVSKIFPEDCTAFFNSVIMPTNFHHIEGVIRFATKIGWGVSLVPVHISDPTNPLPYRTLDYTGTLDFKNFDFKENEILNFITKLKQLKKNFNLYDSDEYLDDVGRFILKKPINWRKKNSNMCDSPNLYFAIAPSGLLKVCCDYETEKKFYVYDKDFPEKYMDKTIHSDVLKKTSVCDGCMYGSYPEVTITARNFSSLLERALYFNISTPKMKKLNKDELIDIAKKTINEQNIIN
tara:strand:+ start:386 stop:1552 length:1167 start_codon:yes stop_codon:yes gene_type:complete